MPREAYFVAIWLREYHVPDQMACFRLQGLIEWMQCFPEHFASLPSTHGSKRSNIAAAHYFCLEMPGVFQVAEGFETLERTADSPHLRSEDCHSNEHHPPYNTPPLHSSQCLSKRITRPDISTADSNPRFQHSISKCYALLLQSISQRLQLRILI